MMIATLVEASGTAALRVLSCPANELEAHQGSFVMWPRSEDPIRVPFAWCYWLRIRDIDDLQAEAEQRRQAREILTDPAKAAEWAWREARDAFIADHGREAFNQLREAFGDDGSEPE